MHGRVGLENFVIDEDKAKESIEKNVESTMTPLIEIGVLHVQFAHQVTSTPTCSIENRDERDKEDAMEEDRRNCGIIRGLAVRGDIKSRIHIATGHFRTTRRQFRFHAFMPWVINFSSILFFCRE